MEHTPDQKRKHGNDLAEQVQMKATLAIDGHAAGAKGPCEDCETLATSLTLQDTVATQQQQACANDYCTQRDTNAKILDLQSERRAAHLEHSEQDGDARTRSIPLSKYRDDRDSAIIHFGTFGTPEGKTFVPKRSVHRNALDDLAHPYDEDQDFFVLDVNLDGDQIDHLLHISKIYEAGDQRNAYQNVTDS